MFMKKIGSLLLALSLVLTLAACTQGSNKETVNQEPSGSTAALDTSKETEKTPVTIKITWWGGQARHDYTQELLDKYTELNPHVTFEAMPSGWDGYFDKLSIQASSSSMPDIIQMDYLYISTYEKNNSIVDLQQFVDNGTIDVSNIDPVLYKSGEINGRLAGMVLSSSILTIGYNPDVFSEAGVDIPTADWTWDDFSAISKQITEKTGKYGFAAIMTDDTNNFNYYVRQHGYPLFSEDNKSLGYEEDQIFIDFVTMMSDLIKAEALPNPDEYEAIKALSYEARPVATGEGAMVTEWSNIAVRLEESNDQIGLITPPYGADGTKGLWVKPGMFFSIAENSKVQQEAAEFINWFINSKEANEIIKAERGTPVSSVVRDSLKTSGILSAKQIEMFEYVDNAIAHCAEAPAPDPIGISEVNEAFKNAVYSVLYDQSKVEDAAASFRKTADEILSRNN